MANILSLLAKCLEQSNLEQRLADWKLLSLHSQISHSNVPLEIFAREEMEPKQRMIDVEGSRLTAGERHTLRTILYRLQSGKPVSEKRYASDSLEAAIDEVFGEAKTKRM